MAGLLDNGQWKVIDQFADDDGKFKRQDSSFRGWISPEGKPGPQGQTGFPPESGRYHLYVSYACPWAHRALIMRRLKGLEDIIGVSAVHPHMLDQGWELRSDFPGATGDPLYGFDYLHQLYTKAKSDYTGKVTVPALWDKQEETIVNNESADLIRIFNTGFNQMTGNQDDYYPAALHEEIDAVNERVYHNINNGVYKAGFATKQNAYEEAVTDLFESLDWLEERLSDGRLYLMGEDLTEADIRLFTTLVRFDAVYYVHFKCNIRRIADYPHLQSYLERVYNLPAVKPTVHMDHICQHYYYSHENLNPNRIVPLGPDLEWFDK